MKLAGTLSMEKFTRRLEDSCCIFNSIPEVIHVDDSCRPITMIVVVMIFFF